MDKISIFVNYDKSYVNNVMLTIIALNMIIYANYKI